MAPHKLVNARAELDLLDERRRHQELLALEQHVQSLGHDFEMPEPPRGLLENAEGIDINFRASPIGLIPYVDLPLVERAGVFTNRMPLWQVVQGPTLAPELSLESLMMYLKSRGYGFHTEIKESRIPLRD